MAFSRKYRYLLPLLLCVPTMLLLWALSVPRPGRPLDAADVWRRMRSEAVACARHWPALDQCFRQAAPARLPSQHPPWAPPTSSAP